MQKPLEAIRPISGEELKALAGASGPCVTIFFPTQAGENAAQQDQVRLRECVRQAEGQLNSLGVDKASQDEFLKPLRELTGDEWQVGRGSFVVLRSTDLFRYFQLPVQLNQSVFAGEDFHLLPLLPVLRLHTQEFYILALSQNHVRLLRCTEGGSEEVPLPPSMPVSLEEWLNTRSPNSAPDHAAQSGPGGTFTSTTDLDNKDQHIANFFHAVDRHVADALRGDPRPMLIAAVEYEQTIYRNLNSYPHLVEEPVTGSPDSLKGGELHRRAIEALRLYLDRPLRKALDLWEKLGGTERVSVNTEQIVKAAFEARIAHLFVDDNAQVMGRFDRSTLTMAGKAAPEEDLANAAAMKTIAFGGDVIVSTPERVPGDNPMSAIFRY